MGALRVSLNEIVPIEESPDPSPREGRVWTARGGRPTGDRTGLQVDPQRAPDRIRSNADLGVLLTSRTRRLRCRDGPPESLERCAKAFKVDKGVGFYSAVHSLRERGFR